MKGEKLEALISDMNISSFYLSLPPHPVFWRFLSFFVLAGYKGIPIFHPFCPCSLLKDLAPKIPTDLGVAEVGQTQPFMDTGLYLIAWLRSSEAFLSMPPVPSCTLGKSFSSLTPCASVSPFIDGMMTSFLTIRECFDALRQRQWVFLFSLLRAETWKEDELFPPTRATSCYTANSSVPRRTPWRRCHQYYSMVHSTGSRVESSTHLELDGFCLQKSKFMV